jgi:hypothetical protein
LGWRQLYNEELRISYSFIPYYWVDQINEVEMGGVFSRHWQYEIGKPYDKRKLGTHRMIILK